MKKSLLIVALAICLLLSQITVYSHSLEEADKVTGVASEEEKTKIIEILDFVALDKDSIGLSDVDFCELRIGEKISRYELIGNELRYSGYSYPLLYNDDVVLMATKVENRFQITTYESELIEQSGFADISLVYMDGNLFIVNIDRTVYYDEHNDSELNYEKAQSIQRVCADNDPYYTNINTTHLLFDGNKTQNINRINGYYSATVDFVSQYSTETCWAASLAMVTNYINGHNYSAMDIAGAYFGVNSPNINNGLDFVNVRQLMTGDLTYTSGMDTDILDDCFCDDDYYYSTSTLCDTLIMYCMQDYEPIIAGFTRTGGFQGHHACVIDAIHTVAGYIRICDPNCGRIYCYRSDDEMQSYQGEYVYTSPASNYFYYMQEQISTYH